MTRMIVVMIAALALAPAAIAGEPAEKQEAPSTETTAAPKDSDVSDIEEGFSIPAADSDTSKDEKKDEK